MNTRIYILSDKVTGAIVWSGSDVQELAEAIGENDGDVILSVEKQVAPPARADGNMQGAYKLKQVILIRKDLGMRRGKEVAQGAHASMAFLSEAYRTGQKLPSVAEDWLEGSFAKVCVKVDSEDEMREIVDKAEAAGLIAHLMVDNGTTEFHGEPTATAAAIGPATQEELEPITGHLRLY